MNNVADKLYNILGTKFNNTDIKTLDETGKETTDMEEIKMFSFDFLVEHRNYGPVVILLSGNNNLEVYYGDNTSKSLNRAGKKKWENLIEHLSTFARSNRLGFSLKHTTDLKYDLSNIANITESYKSIFEGYYGTRKTSYSPQGKAKIIIKHSKAIGEDDKRFRNISSLFIENHDGERFKLPFKKLAGARAMARHVTEGGNPYDLFGLHISEMVNDINTLGGFVRRSKMYEGNDEAMGMVETGRSHYNTMRKNLKQIAGVRGYNTYKESWEPSEITAIDEDTTAIRSLFMDKKVNQRTEDALPLLARLQKMAEARGEMDQAEKIGYEGDDMPFNWPEEVKSKEFPGDTHPDTPDDEDDEDDDIPMRRIEDASDTDDQVADRNKEFLNDPSRSGDMPSAEDTYRMIRGFDIIALRGYARRVGLPLDYISHRADEDDIIDEIMGYLYDDNWERELMATGIFNETTKGQPMKEVKDFMRWADKITEGTWAFPDSPDSRTELKQFMATEQPLGIDAMNATDSLYDILGADDLFDELQSIAKDDPEADARPIVKNYIQTMYRDIDQYAEEDQPNIKKLYRSLGKSMQEGHPQDLDADNDTQLNASINKDMDAHVRNEGEDLAEAHGLSFTVDGNGPYNVMTSKGDIHDTYDDKETAEKKAKELNSKELNENSIAFLMKRTNFLLKG